MHEIITLQLGQLSNYAATHFWNAQEAYFTYSADESPVVDPNVHWRPGVGADGSETFLPRTVVYDLKGGFGSLRKINALYEPESEATPGALWSGASVVHKQPPLEPSAYQRSLDAGTQPPPLTPSTVRYWSDFSRVFYHPRSLVQLYDFELNSTTMPFERFPMGSELFDTLDKEHELVDRDWRPFAEESDCLQGIQVFTTTDDAWGGFASSYIEALRDEYPKSCIWVWGLQNPMLDLARSKRQLRLTNTARSIEAICSQATTLVPVALPEDKPLAGVSLDYASPWHTSALMATAIETAALQSRLASGTADRLEYLAESLNPAGNQPLASLQLSLGLPTRDAPDARTEVDFFQLGRQRSQTKARDARVFGEVLSSRGLGSKADEDDREPGHGNRPRMGAPIVRQYDTDLRFPLLDSYPRIYNDVPADQEELGVQTTLSSNSSLAPRLKALRSDVTRYVEVDEREALSNGLAELADAYKDDWSSGSDEDDD